MIYRERFLNEFMLRKYNCLNEMSFIFLINSDKNPINHNSCTDFLLCYFSLLKRKVANKFKAVAHGISRAVLAKAKGALAGFAGAVTAGVGEYAKGLEAFQKIMVQSGASGISSEIMGGSFKDGFKMGLVTSSARYLYESVVKYKATWESGGDAMSKTSKDTAFKDANNIGVASRTIDKNSWFGEGGRVSRALNQVPGVNAVAGFHDNMQVWFDTVTKSSDGVLRSVMNIPAMIPAVAVTYSALAFEHRNAIIIYRNTKRDR